MKPLFLIISLISLALPCHAGDAADWIRAGLDHAAFGPADLALLQEALAAHGPAADSYMRLPPASGIVATGISSVWRFPRQSGSWTCEYSYTNMKAATQDSRVKLVGHEFTLYDQDDVFVLSYTRLSGGGMDQEYLVDIAGGSPRIRIARPDGISAAPLPLAARDYQCSPWRLVRLKVGEELSFRTWSANKNRLESKTALAQGQTATTLTVITRDEEGPGNRQELDRASARTLAFDLGDFHLVPATLQDLLAGETEQSNGVISQTVPGDYPRIDLADYDSVVYRVITSPGSTLAMANDGRQRVVSADAGSQTIQVWKTAGQAPGGSRQAPEDKPGQYLSAEIAIESDAPEIREAAGTALAGAASTPAKAANLARWVASTIIGTYDVATGTALATLRNKRGDCSEFANLYVALARASGIPARLVAGWSWQPGGFVRHAWAEYLDGGSWTEIDPTLGTGPGCGHLRQDRLSVTWAGIDRVEILSATRRGETVVFDKSLPWWTVRTAKDRSVYRNRIFGLEQEAPHNWMFFDPEKSRPGTAFAGGADAGSQSGLLYALANLRPASDTEPVAVSANQPVYRETGAVETRVDADSVFMGQRVSWQAEVPLDGSTIQVIGMQPQAGFESVSYKLPLNGNAQLILYAVFRKLPPDIRTRLPEVIASLCRTVRWSGRG